MTRRSRAWMAGDLGEPFPERMILAGERAIAAALWREPASARRLLCHRPQARRPRHGEAAAGQGAQLQQPQRHRRGVRAGRRSSQAPPSPSSSTPIPAASPRGIAISRKRYERALACDPVSAFGGIIATNRPLDGRTAELIGKLFSEVIIAPSFSPEALAVLSAKKNLRLLETGGAARSRAPKAWLSRAWPAGSWRRIATVRARGAGDLKVVTKRAPNEREIADLLVRLHRRQACEVQRHRLCARTAPPSASAPGQMSRVDSSRIAAWKSAEAAKAAGRIGELGQGLGRRVRRFLPVRRRIAGRRGSRRHRRDPARRLDARRRRHRRATRPASPWSSPAPAFRH